MEKDDYQKSLDVISEIHKKLDKLPKKGHFIAALACCVVGILGSLLIFAIFFWGK